MSFKKEIVYLLYQLSLFLRLQSKLKHFLGGGGRGGGGVRVRVRVIDMYSCSA